MKIETRSILQSFGLYWAMWAYSMVASVQYYIVDGHITVFKRADGTYSMKDHNGKEICEELKKEIIDAIAKS
jgi:hypothetical protein